MKSIIFLITTSFLMADLLDFKTIAQANRAYAKGDFSKSARLFNSLDSKEATVTYDKANAEYKAGRYDEALKSYEKAKGVNEVQRLHNIGNVYFKKNELAKAIEAYEKALKIHYDEDTKFNLELAKKKKKEKEKNKKEDKKKSDSEKKAKKKQDKRKEEEAEKNMTPKQKKNEAMRKKELKHMLKQLQKRKMPTMMYQTKPKKGERNEQNPW